VVKKAVRFPECTQTSVSAALPRLGRKRWIGPNDLRYSEVVCGTAIGLGPTTGGQSRRSNEGSSRTRALNDLARKARQLCGRLGPSRLDKLLRGRVRMQVPFREGVSFRFTAKCKLFQQGQLFRIKGYPQGIYAMKAFGRRPHLSDSITLRWAKADPSGNPSDKS
jgi:hypothetical protein